MTPFDVVGLTPLMARTSGRPDITIALIDGPVALDHPDLAAQQIREIAASRPAACTDRSSVACAHGTFVAGMLAGKRRSVAPAICPGCSFLSRPIFPETPARNGEQPSATPEELAAAIVDSVRGGARILNLGVNLTQPSGRGDASLAEALNFASSRGAIPVTAAANQGVEADSVLTRHPWVLPVVASDNAGRPIENSPLSTTVGRRGISAPGIGITSLGASGKPVTMSGTSAATGFVTGAIALLWSELPALTASDLRFALTNAPLQRRASVVPPMLNAWAAYQALSWDRRAAAVTR
jgi:subtilisin family serine protease